MKETSPRFTGIFIPVEILKLQTLITAEKMLLSIIDAYFDEEYGGCHASNDYLGEMVGMKPNTVAKSISKFRRLGYIVDVSFNGRKRVIRALIGKIVDKAQSNAELDYNPTGVGLKSNAGLDENPTPSYIDIKEDRKEDKESQMRLATHLLNCIRKLNPKRKDDHLEKWAEDIERLMRIDSRTEQEVMSVIDWVSQDSFWCKNILSGRKLREKFDQLVMAMEAEKLSPNKNGRKGSKLSFDGEGQDTGWVRPKAEDVL